MDTNAIVASVVPVVQHVLAGVLKSSGSGLFGKIREGAAIADYFGDMAVTSGDNPIINGLVDAFTRGDAGTQLSEIAGQDVQTENVMGLVTGLDAVLTEAGEQGTQVKQFIYGLAEKVASAAGEGLFGSGDKVGAGEQQFLDTLKAQLKL